jgi:hypothetical protein
VVRDRQRERGGREGVTKKRRREERGERKERNEVVEIWSGDDGENKVK